MGDTAILIMKFAFRNVLDMIMPISTRDEYWYLGATRDEIDAQEECDAEQEEYDAEQEECAGDDSSEDSEYWRQVFGY